MVFLISYWLLGWNVYWCHNIIVWFYKSYFVIYEVRINVIMRISLTLILKYDLYLFNSLIIAFGKIVTYYGINWYFRYVVHHWVFLLSDDFLLLSQVERQIKQQNMLLVTRSTTQSDFVGYLNYTPMYIFILLYMTVCMYCIWSWAVAQ